jgi:hypothetical protein
MLNYGQQVIWVLLLNAQKGVINCSTRGTSFGVSYLVAMIIPPEKLQSIATIINQYPEVNYNYERENRFNLLFVLMAENQVHLQTTIETIIKTIN